MDFCNFFKISPIPVTFVIVCKHPFGRLLHVTSLLNYMYESRMLDYAHRQCSYVSTPGMLPVGGSIGPQSRVIASQRTASAARLVHFAENLTTVYILLSMLILALIGQSNNKPNYLFFLIIYHIQMLACLQDEHMNWDLADACGRVYFP